MAALTDYAVPRVLDKLLRNEGDFPATWYYALFTTVLDSTMVGTECADVNYARQVVAWNPASGDVSTNDGLLLFPAFAADQTILSIAICDDPSAGHAWLFEPLSEGVTVAAGQQARVLDEAQTVTAV